MKKLKLIAVAAFAAVALYACGGSGTKDTVETADSLNEEMDTTTAANADTAGGAAVAEYDAKFAVDAANAGMAEVALASLAEQKATNADVKAFAVQMGKDHSKANAELTAWATAHHVVLPAAPGDDKQKVADDLGKKMDAEFDKGYVDQMVTDHDKAVSLFDDASKNAVDPDLKAWAAKILPTLKAHQTHIKAIKDKM
ncbi:MAG: DUF4142 domain-containing protein [Sphingobacteriaceae bacterium]|nr:MAG: DUF4142 domain-containing protein [Sphingobacteriaceae bacterium]